MTPLATAQVEYAAAEELVEVLVGGGKHHGVGRAGLLSGGGGGGRGRGAAARCEWGGWKGGGGSAALGAAEGGHVLLLEDVDLA